MAEDAATTVSAGTKLPLYRPEKIIFCIDVDREVDSADMAVSQGKPLTRLEAIKRFVRNMVHIKSKVNSQTQFAIVKVAQSATMYQRFTTSTDEVMRSLSRVASAGDYPECDLTSLFRIIGELVVPLTTEEHYDQEKMTPPFAYRSILFYSRSSFPPSFLSGDYEWQRLMRCEYYFHDVVHLHGGGPGTRNVVDKLKVTLPRDRPHRFYSLARSSNEFFRSAAQLLAHPFQRPVSDDELVPQRSELVTPGEAVSAKSAVEGEGATSADARAPGD